MPAFNDFAGQLVASGIRPNEPVIALENESTRTVLNNLSLIGGLVPKLGRVIIRETRVQDLFLDKYFKKSSLPYGVGFEDAAFMTGASNKKTGDHCIPQGNPDAVSQLNLLNCAWNFEVGVYDREINKSVLTPEEAGQYVAQKMRTMQKGIASLKNRAQIQLISDVIDGTRSISSTENSDGTGTSVTYNPTIKGYAGQVDDTNITLPALSQGTIPTISGADAVSIVTKLENAAAEMKEESTAYSALGIETFTLGRPLLIMETKVLNALDNAFALNGTDKRIPTRSAREYMRVFADVAEIPAFAALPTNASYTNKRLGAVLLDRDSLTDMLQWEDVEAQRCTTSRYTGYSAAGASVMAVYRGNPAYALITDTQ